jgi:hypothetical protein
MRHYEVEAGSSPDEVIGFFISPNSSRRTMALGSTQPLTETSTRKFPGVKGGRRVRQTTLPPSVSRLSRENVGASTSHNPMGLLGLLQGIALPYFFLHNLSSWRTVAEWLTITVSQRLKVTYTQGCGGDVILFQDDIQQSKNKLRGFSPPPNYTDPAIAACRRS